MSKTLASHGSSLGYGPLAFFRGIRPLPALAEAAGALAGSGVGRQRPADAGVPVANLRGRLRLILGPLVPSGRGAMSEPAGVAKTHSAHWAQLWAWAFVHTLCRCRLPSQSNFLPG